MKEIVFVTSNSGKIASAQKELNNIKVLPYNAELIEPRSEDIREIARDKVIQAYNLVKKPCIALDSGFFIKSLNGFPNTFVNHALNTIGIEGILKLMNGLKNRECEFKTCLAYYDGDYMEFFESKAPGTIAEGILGKNNENKWSDLWYIFKPLNFNKTLAQFNEEDFILYNSLKEPTCIEKFGTWYEKLL